MKIFVCFIKQACLQAIVSKLGGGGLTIGFFAKMGHIAKVFKEEKNVFVKVFDSSLKSFESRVLTRGDGNTR
jgi:hypothetical protein